MKKQYLFVMLGFLGSGKSFVSRWLAPHTNAVYIRADDLRLAMFGEDRPELYTPENKALVDQAARYAFDQILQSRQASVILDANNNRYKVRQSAADIARKAGAQAIVVHVNTPLDIAEQRTVTRKETEGHELFAPNLVRNMAARLEPPQAGELVITVGGLADEATQKQQFEDQLARIVAAN
jgi:predicted kinase